MKTVLITGASGFIGSFLVEEATKQGYNVLAGVRQNSSLRHLKNIEPVLFKADLSDKQAIVEALKNTGPIDYVIHNAGITKSCHKNDFDKIIFGGTKNLVEALKETGKTPHKFLYISSLAAYGPGKKNKPVKPDDAPHPVSSYGKSKLKTEKYLQETAGLPYLIFRPTGAYGPREKDYLVMYKTLNKGIETYVGTTEQYLSFIYVKDLVPLLIKALSSPVVNKAYFVSDLNSYTAVEFNKIVKQALEKKYTVKIVFPKTLVKFISYFGEKTACLFKGKPPTLNQDKYKEIIQTNWLCDSSALIKDFDFAPQYDLEKGINETIKWNQINNIL